MEAYEPTSTTGPLRDAQGLPNYAHDADCNTIHDAGPEACPPPRCSQPGHGTLRCDCTPVVVDTPGARLDAPDAVLSPAAAEAVARVAQDVEITRGPLAGMRQRRYVNPNDRKAP